MYFLLCTANYFLKSSKEYNVSQQNYPPQLNYYQQHHYSNPQQNNYNPQFGYQGYPTNFQQNIRVCPMCGCTHFTYNTVSSTTGTSGGIIALMIILFFVLPVIGVIIDIVLLITCCGLETHPITFANCQQCGYREPVIHDNKKIQKEYKKRQKDAKRGKMQ